MSVDFRFGPAPRVPVFDADNDGSGKHCINVNGAAAVVIANGTSANGKGGCPGRN